MLREREIVLMQGNLYTPVLPEVDYHLKGEQCMPRFGLMVNSRSEKCRQSRFI